MTATQHGNGTMSSRKDLMRLPAAFNNAKIGLNGLPAVTNNLNNRLTNVLFPPVGGS